VNVVSTAIMGLSCPEYLCGNMVSNKIYTNTFRPSPLAIAVRMRRVRRQQS